MTGAAPEGAVGSQTLARGLAVLTELSRHPDGLTTAEVAVATGLHRSITHRLLVTLQHSGYATRDDRGRHVIGPAADALATRARPTLRDVAEPVLHQLAREVGATASLVEILGSAAVTTVVAEPLTDGPRLSYRLGNREPLDRGAGGLAALASGPARPGEPARVAEIRLSGHVDTHSELNPGAHGVAAPVHGWGVRAAITVVTADESLMAGALPLLVQAARRVSRAQR